MTLDPKTMELAADSCLLLFSVKFGDEVNDEDSVLKLLNHFDNELDSSTDRPGLNEVVEFLKSKYNI